MGVRPAHDVYRRLRIIGAIITVNPFIRGVHPRYICFPSDPGTVESPLQILLNAFISYDLVHAVCVLNEHRTSQSQEPLDDLPVRHLYNPLVEGVRLRVSHILGVGAGTIHPGRWISEQWLILKALLKV